MNLINKLKEKNNLPCILLLIILVRYIPVIALNAFSKEPSTGDRFIPTIICCSLEIFLLLFFYFNNRKSIKLNLKNIIMLGVIMLIMGSVQLKNIIQKNFYFRDVYNIGCIFLDIILFYIVLYDFKIEQKSFIVFLKSIMCFAIIAIIWNLVLFSKEILAECGIIFENVDYTYLDNPKGFFGNRNILAFIIYLAIICDVIIINLDKEKKIYNILFFVFWFGIWCTHSKTAYIVTVFFIELYILLNKKYNLKNKIIVCSLIGILSILGFLNIMGRIPIGLSQKMDIVENALVINDARVKNLSGRKEIWKSGLEVLNSSPINYIFGVGRINSIQILKRFEDRNYTEFHNLYLEIILTGGLIELLYICFIYVSIIKKILKSDLKIIFKKIYMIMYMMYAMYIMFESLGKFSMGPNDTLCLIFLISIPLLHANSIKQIEEKQNSEIGKDDNE